MKGLTKAQWINLNWKKKSVLVHRYSVLREKLVLSSHHQWVLWQATREGGRPADEMRVGFKIFKILYRLNYLGFYFVYYHSNVTTVLELNFSQLLSSKGYLRCVLSVKNQVVIFSCQSLLLGTSVHNDDRFMILIQHHW